MDKNLDILIVEDDNVLSLMLERMVIKMGHHVVDVVSEGVKAVEAAQTQPCDLILMDIMLEDNLDGISAYGLIVKKKKIPVIYITGNSDILNRERAEVFGYHDYIIKPVVFDDLSNSIKRVASSRNG